MITNVYKRFDPRAMEKEERIGINRGLPTMIYSICRCYWKVHNGEIEIISSFLTDPHCQFRDVGQGMKQTYMYLWYSLFQAQSPNLEINFGMLCGNGRFKIVL